MRDTSSTCPSHTAPQLTANDKNLPCACTCCMCELFSCLAFVFAFTHSSHTNSNKHKYTHPPTNTLSRAQMHPHETTHTLANSYTIYVCLFCISLKTSQKADLKYERKTKCAKQIFVPMHRQLLCTRPHPHACTCMAPLECVPIHFPLLFWWRSCVIAHELFYFPLVISRYQCMGIWLQRTK